MKKSNINKTLMAFAFVTLLSSCQISYSKPITIATAKEIIKSTKSKLYETDYKGFEKISFTSKLSEENTTTFFPTLYLEETYVFEYQADPYSLDITISVLNKENKPTEENNAKAHISKTEDTYMISLNDAPETDINDEQYKFYWTFCDFPTYIKGISQKLVNTAFDLVDSVGNLNDKKENKLAGIQTSSSGDLNLDIEFKGNEFDSKSVFFQDNYNVDTASELDMYMNDGLIEKFSSKYAFTINDKTNQYYPAGTFEGKISNTLKYE